MKLNFTVGPVQADETVLAIGGEQIPYFRTAEFSQLMFENEQMMKSLAGAEADARAVFLTGSGTAAMEAAVMNTLTPEDKALVVNGGGFGKRFADLCVIYGVPYEEISLPYGKALTEELLQPYAGQDFTAFLVNVHETTTGVLYNMELISRFCRENGLFLIADAISSFLADAFDMEAWGVDVMLTGSQKALACPPGISILVLSKQAQERITHSRTKCMYLDLKDALKNGERGQTPFTPAVGVLLQIHARLQEIQAAGGAKSEQKRIAALAADFRGKIRDLPFEIFPDTMSNAVTALHPLCGSAKEICLTLKEKYDIWICPNGGELQDEIFRVGHLGALTPEDNDVLIAALRKL